MREGLMDAWRQRASMQQHRQHELWSQALVGFLTLLLIVVLVYWSVTPDSVSRMTSLQQLLAQAFNLRATIAQPEESMSVVHGMQLDSLEGIEGIQIKRAYSTLSVVIENDILFFPGTADTRESIVLWWQRLVQGLTELNQPLRLVYVQQWQEQMPVLNDRRILAEQAATVGRLLAAEQLQIEQLEFVDHWTNPQFDPGGTFVGQVAPLGPVLLKIEAQIESPRVD